LSAPLLEMPLLEVQGLEAGYDDALILRGIDLAAAAQEIVAIVGPNGAGKSTLLRIMAGKEETSSGEA
jgi:ABC-type multidrug transport system ATPase subunit